MLPKALSPMVSTFGGIATEVRWVFQKALFPMLVREVAWLKSTVDSADELLGLWEKALSPMVFTLPGMATEVRPDP